MATIYFSMKNAIATVQGEAENWQLRGTRLRDMHIQCLTVDPLSKRLYAGTLDRGLWFSDDRAQTWHPVGEGITHSRVTAVAVSTIEEVNGYKVVWAGTEPSGLFRSEDGGKSWQERPSLLDIPSEPTWSFPPRPHTHHVRWIEPDLADQNRIYVGIELGGVMKSEDQGETWEDRKPGSQYDCHTLTMNALSPNRLYEAAGGGYAESQDMGKTWETQNDGLGEHHYLVDIAVDAGDPDTIIVSAARGPRQSYTAVTADTYIYRRQAGQEWQKVSKGFPDPKQTTVSALISDPKEPGHFYAVNNKGMFQSTDSGISWNKLQVDWPEHFSTQRITGIAIADH